MNICLYGASSALISEKYISATEKLGREMAKRGHSLIFGGGANGLMGAAARGVHSENGKIIGVAPSFFNVDGVLFEDCTEFIYTDTMRQRKEIMENRSDAFIMTPGGPGTFDEFFEIFTLRQLGRHTKPIAIFNIDGYYDNLLALFKKTAAEKFMLDDTLNLCYFSDNTEDLLYYIENTKAGTEDISKFKYIK